MSANQPGGIDLPVEPQNPRILRRYRLAFALTSFGYGPAFGSMGTYYAYQIQQIAFATVGFNPGQEPGSGCFALDLPCRVRFGGTDVNLTSFILYLNALIFGISGGLVLLVCGWGDHINYKREQYIGLVFLFGILALPAAALTGLTTTNFNALAALFVIANVIGSIASSWQNIFVPYTMQEAAPIDFKTRIESLIQSKESQDKLRHARELQGVRMSVWGSNAVYLGVTTFLLITVGLAFVNTDTQINAGLYVTTAAGVVCIVCALAGWRFLPSPSSTPTESSFITLPFRTFAALWRGVARYPQAFKFLIAYTIYLDSALTFGTVITNLFNLSVRPSLIEFTAWNVVGSGTSIISATVFLLLFPRTRFTLRHWAIAALVIVTVICVWCLIGMSSAPIGFKHRVEFYIWQVLQSIAGGILTPLFRVLFSEVFPKGSEIQYFGFQMVLSSSTAWIPQVINGPIVDATNNPRLPAVLSLVAYCIAVGLTLWMDDDKGVAKVREEEEASREEVAHFQEVSSRES